MERLWLWLLALAIVGVVGIAFFSQTSPREQTLIQHYAIHVAVDPQARTLEVEAKVQLSCPKRRGTLYLFRRGIHYELLEARVEGGQGQVTEDEDWYVFRFVASSAEPLVIFRYRIESSSDIEGIAFHLGSDEGYVLTESTWVPKTTKEIAVYPPTSYQLTVQVPEPLMAVSAGTLVGESQGVGQRSFTWEMPLAIASPFFAYGSYAVLRELEGEVYILHSLGEQGLEGGRKLLEALQEILAYYRELFGPPPEVPLKIVAVTRRGGWGAPLALLLNYTAFTEGVTKDFAKTYGFLAHEVAHTWWGGLVNCTAWRGCGWLIEGMADYSRALALGHRYGTESEQAVFQDYRDTYLPKAADDIPLAQQAPTDFIYKISSYLKGAWVHRMLEGLLGREKYLDALKAFVQSHRGRAISARDYQRALEQVYGKSLTWFFHQWVEQVVLPMYQAAMESKAVRIVNSGTGEMPLTVRLEYEDRSSEDVRVRVPSKGSVSIPTQKPVTRVVLDPQRYVLYQEAQQEESIDEAVKAELLRLASLLEKALQTGNFALVEAALVLNDQTKQSLALLKRLGAIESFKTELQAIHYDQYKQTYEMRLTGIIELKGQRVAGLVVWVFQKVEGGWSLVNVKIKI